MDPPIIPIIAVGPPPIAQQIPIAQRPQIEVSEAEFEEESDNSENEAENDEENDENQNETDDEG